jgi:hypothetical protein
MVKCLNGEVKISIQYSGDFLKKPTPMKKAYFPISPYKPISNISP